MSYGAFSVGFNWNYWDIDNDNYVVQKYKNLKEEILNYQHLNNNIQLYQKEISPKSKAYHDTFLVKSLKARWTRYNDKYGISEGDIISVEMLICLILYCDYSELSADFSSTFRANNKYEPIQSIKQRNQKYYHLSKGLKECIHVYGQNYYGGRGLLDPLVSPFYCGMSIILNMPSFNIHIFGPTSTTKQIEVATRFSGDEGIIIHHVVQFLTLKVTQRGM